MSPSAFDTNIKSLEVPFRDYPAMLIKYAEKIKWGTDETPTLSEHHSESPVMLCDQRQWVCGGSSVGLGSSPWRTTLLPFPVHQWQLPWGNSRYQMFGHLVTVVSCQIQQIRPHLAAHGCQIIGLGYRWNCHMCSTAGGWQGGWEEDGKIINNSVDVNIQINPDFRTQTLQDKKY